MGIPAIVAYPMTSGIKIAAITLPAINSAMNLDLSRGNNPSKNVRFAHDIRSGI
jgi:hypothetical protein